MFGIRPQANRALRRALPSTKNNKTKGTKAAPCSAQPGSVARKHRPLAHLVALHLKLEFTFLSHIDLFRCSAQTQDPCLFRWALGHWPIRNLRFHNKTLSGGQTGNLPNFVLCTLNKTLASQSGQQATGQTGTPFSTTRPSPFGGHNQAIGQPQKQELCLPQAISHPSALHKTKTLASAVGTQRPLAKQDPCLLVGTLKTSLHTSALAFWWAL